MRRIRFCLALLGLSTALSVTIHADPAKPLLTKPGKILVEDKLDAPFAKDWKAGKGKWEVIDGATKGKELKEDMHGAVARRPFTGKNVVIDCDFKLEGARSISFSINDAKHHICRVGITPNGFVVQKDDQDGKDGPDKAMKLDESKTPIKVGEWHHITIEMFDKEILAVVDGKEIAFGEHDTINVPKANLGLTIAGESASYRNLKIAEAEANSEWAATKAKLKPTK